MTRRISGFDWDEANREKCRKHGVSTAEIEELLSRTVMTLPHTAHSDREPRYRAIGRSGEGRHVFVVFTMRRRAGGRLIRPISARFMHRKVIAHYEEENPDVQNG